MKLKDAVDVYRGQTVKIGSASSFVFIGKLDEQSLETLRELSKKYHERIEYNYHHFDVYLNNFEVNEDKRWADQIIKFDRSCLRRKVTQKVRREEYKKLRERYLEEKAKRKRNAETRRDYCKRALDEWTEFEEREVKEVYPSIELDNIIIFEGYETGKYWTLEEAERGSVQNDNGYGY